MKTLGTWKSQVLSKINAKKEEHIRRQNSSPENEENINREEEEERKPEEKTITEEANLEVPSCHPDSTPRMCALLPPHFFPSSSNPFYSTSFPQKTQFVPLFQAHVSFGTAVEIDRDQSSTSLEKEETKSHSNGIELNLQFAKLHGLGEEHGLRQPVLVGLNEFDPSLFAQEIATICKPLPFSFLGDEIFGCPIDNQPEEEELGSTLDSDMDHESDEVEPEFPDDSAETLIEINILNPSKKMSSSFSPMPFTPNSTDVWRPIVLINGGQNERKLSDDEYCDGENLEEEGLLKGLTRASETNGSVDCLLNEGGAEVCKEKEQVIETDKDYPNPGEEKIFSSDTIESDDTAEFTQDHFNPTPMFIDNQDDLIFLPSSNLSIAENSGDLLFEKMLFCPRVPNDDRPSNFESDQKKSTILLGDQQDLQQTEKNLRSSLTQDVQTLPPQDEFEKIPILTVFEELGNSAGEPKIQNLVLEKAHLPQCPRNETHITQSFPSDKSARANSRLLSVDLKFALISPKAIDPLFFRFMGPLADENLKFSNNKPAAELDRSTTKPSTALMRIDQQRMSTGNESHLDYCPIPNSRSAHQLETTFFSNIRIPSTDELSSQLSKKDQSFLLLPPLGNVSTGDIFMCPRFLEPSSTPLLLVSDNMEGIQNSINVPSETESELPDLEEIEGIDEIRIDLDVSEDNFTLNELNVSEPDIEMDTGNQTQSVDVEEKPQPVTPLPHKYANRFNYASVDCAAKVRNFFKLSFFIFLAPRYILLMGTNRSWMQIQERQMHQVSRMETKTDTC